MAAGNLWAWVKAIFHALLFCKHFQLKSDSSLAVGWVRCKANRPWKLLNDFNLIDGLISRLNPIWSLLIQPWFLWSSVSFANFNAEKSEVCHLVLASFVVVLLMAVSRGRLWFWADLLFCSSLLVFSSFVMFLFGFVFCYLYLIWGVLFPLLVLGWIFWLFNFNDIPLFL